MSVTAKVFNYVLKHSESNVIDVARGCKLTHKRSKSALELLQQMRFVESDDHNFAPTFSVPKWLTIGDLVGSGFEVKIK